MWRPRDPGWRGNLLAELLRVNKSDDAPVSYRSGGQKFSNDRRWFLERYRPAEGGNA